MKTPDLSDAEVLFLEAISKSEDGDRDRALDLLRLARQTEVDAR